MNENNNKEYLDPNDLPFYAREISQMCMDVLNEISEDERKSLKDNDAYKKVLEDRINEALSKLPDVIRNFVKFNSIDIGDEVLNGDYPIHCSDCNDIDCETCPKRIKFDVSFNQDALEASMQNNINSSEEMIIPIKYEVTGFISIKAPTPEEALKIIIDNFNEFQGQLPNITVRPVIDSLEIPKPSDIKALTYLKSIGQIDKQFISKLNVN